MSETILFMGAVHELLERVADGDALGLVLLLRVILRGALIGAIVYEIWPCSNFSSSVRGKIKQPFRTTVMYTLLCLLFLNHLIHLMIIT
jgi:hypothetical protein